MHLISIGSENRSSINARRASILAAAVAAVAGLGLTSSARADLISFTPGDIVVLSGGSQAEDAGTVPATLLEYTPTGTFVGQLAVPSSTSGSNNPLTLNNASVASHEGQLTLSENKQYLAFGGYNLAPGSTAFNNPGINGTIGFVGKNASTLNTSTTIATGAQSMRAVTTINGTQFYVAQSHGGSSSGPGGLNYVSGVGASATNTSLGGTLDPRSVAILGGSSPSTGVLAAGSGSSSFSSFGGTGHGVYGLTGSGGGLPTSTPIAGSQISADASDGTDQFYTNEGAGTGYHGYNTLYLASDTGTAGNFIEKLVYNSTTGKFTKVGSTVGTVGGGVAIGITVQPDPTPGIEDVFYTESTGIYKTTSVIGSSTAFSGSGSLLVSPGSDAAFYGIANSPVPEPASLGLLGLGALGLLGRRNRRTV